MNMAYRFLILNTDYAEFQRWLYSHHRGMENLPYEEQLRLRNESLFGTTDSYPYNLRKLGHEAHEIHVNHESMQKAWAREHGLRYDRVPRWQFRMRRGIVPWFTRFHNSSFWYDGLSRQNAPPWYYEILKAQIEYYRPDVLYDQISGVASDFLKEVRPFVRLIVGQIASPPPEEVDFGCYDLIVSSLPNLVERFRSQGVDAEFHRLAFDPRVLGRLKPAAPDIPVSFVGNLLSIHSSRVQFLEDLCTQVDLQVWSADRLSKDSPIRARNRGTAWGLAMYQLMQRSKITLNHHINMAESYANNMRLYEATGVGACLVTDWKPNLGEMFEPGKEVVAYRSPRECRDLIHYYLAHDVEREALARAGQQRTLRDHTYERRMQELVELVRKRL
jgi:hypothetical protein